MTDTTINQGWFYIIQLDPRGTPNRLKFGFAKDVAQRLQQHHTAAPTAALLGVWPAKRSWERAIIESLTVSAEQVGTEVFDVADVYEVLEKTQKLMDLMPQLLVQAEETTQLTTRLPASLKERIDVAVATSPLNMEQWCNEAIEAKLAVEES